PPCTRAAKAGLQVSTERSQSRPRTTGQTLLSQQAALPESKHHQIDQVVHAELVGFIREIDRREAGIGPLPVLRHVVVVVGDDLQRLARVVVLRHAVERRGAAAIVGLHEIERSEERRVGKECRSRYAWY